MKSNFFSKIKDAFLIVLIVAIIISSILFIANTFNVFPISELFNKMFLNSQEVVLPSNEFENEILELIKANEPKDEYNYSYISLTPDKATLLLSDFETTDKYFWEVETTTVTENRNRKQTHRVYKKGDKIRIDTIDAYSDSTVVFSNGVTKIKNNKTGKIREISGDTAFSYDNIVNIAALNYLFSDSGQVVDFVSVSENSEEKYLYIETSKKSIKGKDVFFISLEHGVVLTANSEIDDKTIFLQKTLNFDTVSLISDDTFDLVHQN